MQIDITLTAEPIEGRPDWPGERAGQAGAVARFRGIVRGEEDGRPIVALEYEAYASMAEPVMRRILDELGAAHPCQYVRVIHRVGVVPIGEAAIEVLVASAHRGEAFALLAAFMDRLKQDVPIWKCRALSGGAVSADEAMARVRQFCPALGTERVSLAEAAGRTLREAIGAPEDQPAFDRSAMDGYAVRLDESATRLRVVDDIRAGDWKPRSLQPGEAVRIATGGALPDAGLCVVKREDTTRADDTVTVLRRETERHIRFRGEDARAGQVLVEAGTVLRPGPLALLASLGHAQPLVSRLPRVGHVATGSEIVPPEQPPGPGQIRDSNSTLVRAFFGRWGIVPESSRVPEDEAAARAAIARHLAPGVEADLLLVSGGASVGEQDFTRRLLADLGFTLLVQGTKARPGKPLLVGRRGRTLAFGLPGNPLAHFVCLHLYARAALQALAGRQESPHFETGTLAATLDGGENPRETFWPAQRIGRDGMVLLAPLRWSSSGDLTALATANALIRVASGAGSLPAGSHVPFLDTEETL
jgi:molybdopterin molybdotransferase